MTGDGDEAGLFGAEDFEGQPESHRPQAAADRAAPWSALGAASRAKADVFIDEQTALARKQVALADLQMKNLQLENDNLQKQDEYELSHLRWRRFNDQMKGAMQIMIVALGALIVIGVGAAVWNASQADGIVVDAFAVPPQSTANGVTGDVIADDITNRIIAIRDLANTHSLGRSKDVRLDTDDIKVEIPDTGISITQAWRYLRGWLGNEHHLRGSLRNTGDGKLELALDGEDAAGFKGSSADLDTLEEKAAEHVFASADPAQYVVYLAASDRMTEAEAEAEHSALNTTINRADFYALWANELHDVGEIQRALAIARFAETLDPRSATAHLEVMSVADTVGHDEMGLDEAVQILNLKNEDQPVYERGEAGFSAIVAFASENRDLKTGDFLHAFSECDAARSIGPCLIRRATRAALLHDDGQARTLFAQALAAGNAQADDIARARYLRDALAANWRAGAADARVYAAALKIIRPRNAAIYALTEATPMLAYALAKGGDVAAARTEIASTPMDCYDCLVKRGDIEAVTHNWREAASWFADAVHQAPRVPFAYSDWGAMLLAMGELDGAIAKFKQANDKGPHFADPLELWGEALMLKNRSDLALAKFEEADKYAPNWGRLHLKWGEALWWSGDKDGARKQFAIAAVLTPSEKPELMKVERLHG